jgi:putative polyketide hydroxylase
MPGEQIDVLVVCAGPGGVAATLFPAQQGVRAATAERHLGTSLHPRASGQSPRSMERYRWAGIGGEVLGEQASLAGAATNDSSS